MWTDVNPTTRTQVGIRRVLKFEKNICFCNRVKNRTCSRAHFAYCCFRPGLFQAVWGGVRWATINVHVHTLTRWMLRCYHLLLGGGVGWDGWDGWADNFHLHSHTHIHMSCYTPVCSLALLHRCHATLLYVLLRFHTHTHVTLCSCTFSCTSTQRHATLLYVLCIFFNISRKAATFFALHHGASRSPVCGPMVCDTEAVQMERLCPNQGKVSREDEAVSNLTSEDRLPEVVPLAAYSCNYGT